MYNKYRSVKQFRIQNAECRIIMNNNIIVDKSFDFAVRIYKTNYIDKMQFESLQSDINEIISILIKICKTSNSNK